MTQDVRAVRAQRLQPERVHRFYRGGALLGRLSAQPETDGFSPENWLGSVTAAANPDRDDPEEGLSRLSDGRLLRDAIEADSVSWLGEAHVACYGHSTGLLVKLLDAAERLPVHAHPDRAFAREHLHSRFGKTEAWVVLATRDDAGEVSIGLSAPVDASEYRTWIDEQNVEALHSSLNRVEVRAGETIYVPAGIPHAIGAGVFLAELQEPTDFSIICEWQGFPIRPEDSHLGLGWDTVIEALVLDAHEPVRRLPEEARAFFWLDRDPGPADRFAVLVVLEGEGRIDGEHARAGDAFAVPAAAKSLALEGDLSVLRCLAPEPV
jgi:mannose-6-phosphate isomerase